MQIVFDFDGTLNNIAEKYYHCYSDCVLELRGSPLNAQVYRRLHRNTCAISILLKRSGLEDHLEHQYVSLFTSKIETPHYLAYDRLFEFSLPTIHTLVSKGHTLYICSARKNTELGMQQVKSFGLLPFLSGCDIARHTPNVRVSKNMAIKRMIHIDTPWIGIGDTEDDINSFTDNNGIAVAVLSGLRNASKITQLAHPRYCITDMREVPSLLDFEINRS